MPGIGSVEQDSLRTENLPSSNFIDHVKLCARSGTGGAGSVHFRREKHVPKGGPDGGDGGRGGHILLEGDQQLWTLLHLRYKKHVIAGNGEAGGSSGKTGAQGNDIVLKVPLGTVARSAETGAVLTEITELYQLEVLTPGGRG
jgi:GTP-binding protein